MLDIELLVYLHYENVITNSLRKETKIYPLFK